MAEALAAVGGTELGVDLWDSLFEGCHHLRDVLDDERRRAERLYTQVIIGRAFRRRAADRSAEALADFEAVAKRTGMDRPRVVIPGNPRGMLRAMLEERRPVYAKLATITVPTDDMAPEEVAADLAKRLRA